MNCNKMNEIDVILWAELSNNLNYKFDLLISMDTPLINELWGELRNELSVEETELNAELRNIV